MTRTCPHCGYRQEDYEVPVVNGKIQCRKCRETLTRIPSFIQAARAREAALMRGRTRPRLARTDQEGDHH